MADEVQEAVLLRLEERGLLEAPVHARLVRREERRGGGGGRADVGRCPARVVDGAVQDRQGEELAVDAFDREVLPRRVAGDRGLDLVDPGRAVRLVAPIAPFVVRVEYLRSDSGEISIRLILARIICIIPRTRGSSRSA